MKRLFFGLLAIVPCVSMAFGFKMSDVSKAAEVAGEVQKITDSDKKGKKAKKVKAVQGIVNQATGNNAATTSTSTSSSSQNSGRRVSRADQQKLTAINTELQPITDEIVVGNRFALTPSSFTTPVSEHIISEATTNLTYWAGLNETTAISLRYALLSDAVQKKSRITPELVECAKTLTKGCTFFGEDSMVVDHAKGAEVSRVAASECPKWNAFIEANLQAVQTPAEFLKVYNFLHVCLRENSESDFPDPESEPVYDARCPVENYVRSSNSIYSPVCTVENEWKYCNAWLKMHEQHVKAGYQPKEFACIAQGDVAGFKASWETHKTCDVRYFEELSKAPVQQAKEIAAYLYENWRGNGVGKCPSPAELFIPNKNYALCDALYAAADDIRGGGSWPNPGVFAVSTGDVDYLKHAGGKLDLNGGFAYGEAVLPEEQFLSGLQWMGVVDYVRAFPQRLTPNPLLENQNAGLSISKKYDVAKEMLSHYCHTVLEIALISGQIEIATYLYDELGAPDPRIDENHFWMSLSVESAPAVVEWLVSCKLLTAQKAYEKALEIKSVPLAKALEEKFGGASIIKKFDAYFAANDGKPTPEQAVEFAKYLVSKGLATEDKAADYSALAILSLNSLRKDTLNKPATVAVIRYLVENGADVTMRAQRYKEIITENDLAKVSKLADSGATYPDGLGVHQSELGLDDAGMQKLITDVREAKELAGMPIPFLDDGHVSLETQKARARNKIRPMIQEALLATGKIKMQKTLESDVDALGAAAINKDLELVKLIVEKGGKLPCMVTDDKGQPVDVSAKTSDEIANYLRAAERRRRRAK